MSDKYAGRTDPRRMRLVPPPAPYTYWLTRDVDTKNGVEWVVVWSERPRRTPLVTGGATWSNVDPRGELVGLVETIWPLECWKLFGTAPEDDIECIRVERNTEYKTLR